MPTAQEVYDRRHDPAFRAEKARLWKIRKEGMTALTSQGVPIHPAGSSYVNEFGKEWMSNGETYYRIDRTRTEEQIGIEVIETGPYPEVLYAEQYFPCDYCLVPRGVRCRVWNPQVRTHWTDRSADLSDPADVFYRYYCHGARKQEVNHLVAATRSL